MPETNMEEERLEKYRYLMEDFTNQTEIEKKYGPGSFGCHEALHVSSMLTELVIERLLDHPTIVMNKKYYDLANEASEKLNDLYNAIGEDHLNDKNQE